MTRRPAREGRGWPSWHVRSSGYTGHGYITEAVRAITSLAIETLGAGRVEIRCDPRNHKSTSVAERAGFQLEATLHNNELGIDGSLRNTLIYSLLGGNR